MQRQQAKAAKKSAPKSTTKTAIKKSPAKKQAKRSLTTKKIVKKNVVTKTNTSAIPTTSTFTRPTNTTITTTSFLQRSSRFFSAIGGEGSDPAFAAQPKQTQSAATATAQDKSQTEQEQDDISQQIDAVVKAYGVVLFMKGTPSEPRCGFSRRVVQILHEYDITYEACNVLESDDLREAIKTYSNWPTIPQLYVGGEFVGGCDIVTQMHENGELAQVLPINKRTDEKTETAKEQAV